MTKFQFPDPFQHDHPPVRNVNELVVEGQTLGQRASDLVAKTAGSWKFIIWQSCLLLIWVALNIVSMIQHWDPYPFILMNLLLSLQAAYTAPIIMMSQNRQAQRDRIEAHHDYDINQKAEVEIRAILDHLAAQDLALAELHKMVSQLAAK
ncbi:MAG: DUF1003 domain-containing protein [Planctomycetaceae bacterium]|nr:DUF1003 domain-containing protein [Planctomycetaceae bacterium]